jgi:CRP/FNR family transcriptional regulator, cyclic AMP receptor protein
MTGSHASGPALASVPLFSGIDQKELSRLESRARVRPYQAGDVIVEQGSVGVALFVIRSGCVRVTQKGQDGQERELRTMGPGEAFGEMALFNNRPRSATITATEPTECLALHQLDFLDELRKAPELAIRLLDTLSQRLVDAEQRRQ